MPKKFNGISQKAASASARKAAAEELKMAMRQKELEDQQWEDNDKHVLRKQKRKEEKEQKKQSASEKKAEKKVLLDQEAAKINAKAADTSKVTRAEIDRNVQRDASNVQRPKTLQPLEENVNRLEDETDARSVTEAIAVLNFRQLFADKNPTKRMKSSYKAFEKSRLETLRKENPSLRLNQVKQLLQKEWDKSPQNPLNKMH